MAEFIDRKRELEALEERYRSGKAELLVVYGRRRVGKTELLKTFFKDKNHLYFLADMQKEEKLLEIFSGIARTASGREYLELRSWDAFFDYLRELAEDRIVVVLDEVGYLNKANPAFYSILQRHWDEDLSSTKIVLILCGSSVSMMEKEVLGYGSPLYGRRSGQIELKPMSYRDARAFFPKAQEAERIEFYSVLGGVPAYLNKFDIEKDVMKEIRNNILNPEKFLYKEPRFILLEELREPATYFSILSAIAQGARKYNEISQKSYVEPTKLSKYLQVLIDLRLVEKITPITEKKKMRRNSIYKIKDNFFTFWFRFINPNTSMIEEGNIEPVMEQIRRGFKEHTSKVFEDVCREAITIESKNSLSFTSVGSWWDKGEEIDIVAINEGTKDILFGECKWGDKKVDADILLDLERKAEYVKWQHNKRTEHFAVFSKAGFTNTCSRHASEKGIRLYELKDIEEIFGSL